MPTLKQLVKFENLSVKGIYPCTSLLSYKIGNLIVDGKIDFLWQNSPVINCIREIKNKSTSELPYCFKCKRNNKCQGGCRGDALFYTNDFYGISSRCPEYLKTAPVIHI